MRAAIAGCALVAATLCACSSPPQPRPPAPPVTPVLPPSVGNGVGSEFGNYTGKLEGDAKGPAGQHCVVFNWDRPLNRDFAIRYSSLSCDQEGRAWKTTTTYTRSVVPIAQSTFARDHEEDTDAH